MSVTLTLRPYQREAVDAVNQQSAQALHALFPFLNADQVRSASKLLREAHVVAVPGEAFGTKEHIRLSYATSMKEVERGLERMKKFFGAL